MSQILTRNDNDLIFVRKYKTKGIHTNNNYDIRKNLKYMSKQELINENIKLKEEITLSKQIIIFNHLKNNRKHKITLTLHAGTGVTDDRDDNLFANYLALDNENTLLDTDGDVMSWHADSTEDHEDCTAVDKSNSVDHSIQFENNDTSKVSTEDDSLHNTETELRDHPFQEKDTSPIMTNNTNLIINKESEKGEDTTEVFPIDGSVQIPSMLKTQMLLDEKYLGKGTFSKHMSLKIKKKTKAVTKRDKISKHTKKVIEQQTKSVKKKSI